MKSLLKKIVPKFVFTWYYYCLAFLGAAIYRFPSRKLIVIGITGTKGKSTTLYLAGKILQNVGIKTGWISSLSINNGDEEKINPYHMTMPGRFFIQKMMRQFYENGCKAVIVETTSEGIKQFRHKFINFDTLLFTNIAPEHIEAHGSFKKYKKTKLIVFKELNNSSRKNISGKKIPKTIISNLDNEFAKCFLEPEADQKIGYKIYHSENKGGHIEQQKYHPELVSGSYDCHFESSEESQKIQILQASNIQATANASKFTIDNTNFSLQLLGTFNIYNALGAISIAKTLAVDIEKTKQPLENIAFIPGRMEKIKVSEKQNFDVFVDLAHTPNSYEEIFSFVKNELKPKKIISVFGSAGGGRDKWKRPEMGAIAGENSDYVIITDEDPYKENPDAITADIEKGVASKTKNYEIIHDRKKAIKKALNIAQKNDVVLLLGKGTEATMCFKDKTIPWNEKKTAEDELKKMF